MDHSSGTKRRIAILYAMEAEARPLVTRVGLKTDPNMGDPRLKLRQWSGRYRDFHLLVSVNMSDERYHVDSIGTEPATLNAYVTIDRFRPHLVINAGTAGGFIKRGGAIGDVYISAGAIAYHDHRIPIPGGFEEYGRGSFQPTLPEGLLERTGLKPGVITTGSSLDATPRDLELIEQNGAHAKDMEAAAIAWVCLSMQTPFFALKSITDLVDGPHPTQAEFLHNLDAASRALTDQVIAVLDTIANS